LVIGVDAFHGGSRIAAWHLHEAKRFYGHICIPADLDDAARLSFWLVEFCKRTRITSISTTKVMQLCTPIRLRKKAILHKAILQLVEFGHIRFKQVGNSKTIHINPLLLKEEKHGSH
jgi:putative DNA primase/helicase